MSAENLVHLLKSRREYSEGEPKLIPNVGAREEPPTTAATPEYFRASSETGTFLVIDRLAVPLLVIHKWSLQDRRSSPNTFGSQSLPQPGSWGFASCGDGDLRSWESYSHDILESSGGEKTSNFFLRIKLQLRTSR
jgi:hypothetical protein